MPDTFNLLDEVHVQPPARRRERFVPKSNRAKPKLGLVDMSHWGNGVRSLDRILDSKRGLWEVVYATWQGTDVPTTVSPELAEFIDRHRVSLVLSPSRETGLMYVRGRFPVPGYKHRVRMALHRFACGLPPPGKGKRGGLPIEVHVNHQTRYTLDNRNGNLEVVIPAVNLRERSTVGTGFSKYCGVSLYRSLAKSKGGQKHYRKSSKPYRVICWFGGRRFNVGLFADEDEAGRAYDKEILYRIRRSVRMMRIVGTILPFAQINRLLNFERPVEELEAYFRAAMKRAKANAPKGRRALRQLGQAFARNREHAPGSDPDVPF